ncbi:MAG: hypothetical protein R3C09_25145 [Pirellulaceae bacterium]
MPTVRRGLRRRRQPAAAKLYIHTRTRQSTLPALMLVARSRRIPCDQLCSLPAPA